MAHYKVHASLETESRTVELNRKDSITEVRNKILAKFKISSANLRFVTPRGDFVDLNSDAALQRSLQEASDAKLKALEVKVVTGSSYSSAPASPAHYTAASTASPAAVSALKKQEAMRTPTSSPSKPSGPTSQPSTPIKGESHIVTWNIPANKSTTSDKVKINHAGTYDAFTFTAVASKYDTEVAVVLGDSKKLQFNCTYSFPDNNGVRTVTVTQNFGLPVEVAIGDIEIMSEFGIKLWIRRH